MQVINVFALRTQCLFDIEDMEFEVYREEIMPRTIYKKEQELVDEKKQVFVLSAFPEFILDYFREDFWNANVKLKKLQYDECPKKQILEFQIKDAHDVIHIAKDFPDEYSNSEDTMRLKGTLAKAKANASQGIPYLIQNATDKTYLTINYPHQLYDIY